MSNVKCPPPGYPRCEDPVQPTEEQGGAGEHVGVPQLLGGAAPDPHRRRRRHRHLGGFPRSLREPHPGGCQQASDIENI